MAGAEEGSLLDASLLRGALNSDEAVEDAAALLLIGPMDTCIWPAPLPFVPLLLDALLAARLLALRSRSSCSAEATASAVGAGDEEEEDEGDDAAAAAAGALAAAE